MRTKTSLDPVNQQEQNHLNKNDNRASKTSTAKRQYEAFDRTGKPSPYLEIRCALQPSQSPQSRFFMATVFDSDNDDTFTLLYSYMAVEVKGHNLREARRAIQAGRCEFIQQYHENTFTKPGKGDPVIESINFITGKKLDNILSTYKGGQMFDGAFPFVDLILEPTEADVSHSIAQFDAFPAPTEKKRRVPVLPHPLSEETFKEMWMLRYQQYLGHLTFLELLDKYEEILGISSQT